MHAAQQQRIHPSLNVHSMLGFCVQNYVLGSFSRRFGTTPLGRAAPAVVAELRA